MENIEQYQGLISVDVTARFSSLLWAGFILELLILLFIIVNMVSRNKLLKVSTVLGYLSFIWFIILLFFRFDHYGKVCSGDYLDDGVSNTFEAIDRAAYFLKLFSHITGYCVGGLFLIVLIYTCITDTRKDDKEDEDKQE